MRLLISSVLILLTLIPAVAQVDVKDDVPTEREIKEWCLALDQQNRMLWQNSLRKDTIIQDQNTLLLSKDKQIESYQNDSTSFSNEIMALREESKGKSVIIKNQERSISKIKTRNTLGWIGAILLGIAGAVAF
jgi:hypothetical protein